MFSGGEGGRLRAWDYSTDTSQAIQVSAEASFVLALYAAADGRLFVGNKSGALVSVADDLQTVSPVFDREKSAVRVIAGGSDPTKLVVAYDFGRLYLIDLQKPNAAPTRAFEGHTAAITDVLPLPDSTQFITSSLDRTIRHWDTRSGYIGAFVGVEDKLIWAMAFLPQSSEVVLGADSGELLAYSR